MKDTLKTVVSDFLMESGYGQAEFTRAYQIGLRGLRELTFDITGETATTKLLINPDGTAYLPENCVKVVSLLRNVDGELVAMTRNTNIAKAKSMSEPSCGCEGDCKGVDYGCRRAYENSNVAGRPNIPFYTVSLGVGSWHNVGEYRIDGEVIYFGNNLVGCSDIWIEYIPLYDQNKELVVHPLIKEALVAWIRWRFHINRKNQDKWDKQYFEKEWHREKTNAKYRLKMAMRQELNQVARQHKKEGLKS